MKKSLSLILILGMILSSISITFAQTGLTDTQNTPYQKAVENLIDKGIINGYPDNTFLPENSITRAEACVIVVKAMDPANTELSSASGNQFSDVLATYWGSPYIHYAAIKNVVSGYEDNTFGPKKEVTYYEMAAILVNAAGFKVEELDGVWPNNYFEKAKELGIFDHIDLATSEFDGNAPATRGNVALMVAPITYQIMAANKTIESPEEEAEPQKTTSKGVLADYSGRAYGIILDCSTVIGEDGDQIQELEFLYGNHTEYLITKSKTTFNGILDFNKGDLYCLKMTNGIVTDISTDGAVFGSSTYKEYTANNSFQPVVERKDRSITINNNGNAENFSIFSTASIYVATKDGLVIDGYKVGKINDIKAGSEIRLFSVTKDSFPDGPIEIVIVNP